MNAHPAGSVGAPEGPAVLGRLRDHLLVASDHFVGLFMNDPAASPWARADLLSDGRHNSPPGATSLGTTHIRAELPLSFEEFNASGPRQPATAKTVDEVRQIHLGYVPVGGGIAEDLSSPSWGELGHAVDCYLDLVEATVQRGAAPVGNIRDNGS